MGSSKGQVRRLHSALLARLRRRGKLAVFLLTLFTLFLTGVHLSLFNYLMRSVPVRGGGGPPPPPMPAISEPAAAHETMETVEGRIRKGTGLAANLLAKGLAPADVSDLLTALSPALDFRRLRPGDRFSIGLDPRGTLVQFTYQAGPFDEVVLRRTEEGWEGGRRAIPSETRVETVVGKIESSLFESLGRLGEGDRLTMEFVDIFAWDIDFSHELQRGDTFRIVVEKIYRDGEFVTYGRILAAQYRDSEDLHEAFFFPYPSDGGDYYGPDGTAVRKTFLKAPVSYSRISSGYSRRRLHPILKRVRPHLGVDYAAPAGTPVWAAADGVVVSMGHDRANGKRLVLRHPNGYRSSYLHLSRYGRGIKVGSRVRQKDVVGYVGSSGLSTGPHLDYRLERNGRWVNPLKEKFPPGAPLPASQTVAFEEYREWLAGRLVTPPDTFLALAGGDHTKGGR